jgi:hypothetical protein
VIFINSCSVEEENKNVSQFEFNFDVLAHNSGENAGLIRTDLSKTGYYCAHTDSTIIFSSGYTSKIKDFDKKIPNKISIEGYFLTESNVNDGSFVLSLEDTASKFISYQIAKTSELVKQNGVWTQFNLVLVLDSLAKNPENTIKFYGWGQGKGKTYYDDIKISFE